MNERPGIDRLRQAMRNANVDELGEAVELVGRDAVQVALAMVDMAEPPDVKQDGSAEAQRQRDLDAALADAIEVVARARTRQARRVCSRHDGETVRRVWELLRSVMSAEAGADNDPSFQ